MEIDEIELILYLEDNLIDLDDDDANKMFELADSNENDLIESEELSGIVDALDMD